MEALTTRNIELSDKDFQRISGLVYGHCKINLHAGKKELVRARLAKRLRIGNLKNFPDYIKHVLEDETGKEFSVLIDSLSTNLTSFFREPQHFKFLQEKHLPALMERKQKQKDLRIRAWSAGCSSGEEPYSIAILLKDALHGKGQWDAKILATDISTKMLDSAKSGIYSKERVQPVPAMQRQKYLIPKTGQGITVYEASSILKNMVYFRYLNLMDNWPFTGPMDFIFCRNVMIYFDKPTQQRLISRYWDTLAPGGILFTGHSESLTGIEHKFKYVQPTIYMKP